MCAFQEVENIFLEIRSGVDLSFVEKRLCSGRFDLAGDLPRHPCVLLAVAYEHEQLVRRNVERHIGGSLQQQKKGNLTSAAHPKPHSKSPPPPPPSALDA